MPRERSEYPGCTSPARYIETHKGAGLGRSLGTNDRKQPSMEDRSFSWLHLEVLVLLMTGKGLGDPSDSKISVRNDGNFLPEILRYGQVVVVANLDLMFGGCADQDPNFGPYNPGHWGDYKMVVN